MPLLTGAKPYRAGKKTNYVSKEKHCTHIGNNVNASYVEQYKVDGEVFPVGSGPERCDFLLLNENAQTAYYIELKGSSIPKAIQQLNNTVSMLKARHPQCDKIFYRIIYRSGSHETNSSETLRWKKKVGIDRVVNRQTIPEEYSENLFVSMLGWVQEKIHQQTKQNKPAFILSEDYRKELKAQVRSRDIRHILTAVSIQPDASTTASEIERHDTYIKQLELCDAIAIIEESAIEMKTVPAAFEREMQVVNNDISQYSEKLSAVRKRISIESHKTTNVADKKYTLSEISRFLGRLDASLQTYERIGKDSELDARLAELSDRVEELSHIVDEKDIKKKQEAAIKYIKPVLPLSNG